MLNTTPVTTAMRLAASRRGRLSVYRIAEPQVAAGCGSTADSLIDVLYALNSKYRANATWIMNSKTAAQVRKLKDANGNYLWAPGLIGGQPDTLLGRPVSTWEQIADIGTNAFPIANWRFSRAYMIVQRPQGVRITVDNVTLPGFVRFYVRRREAGIVHNYNTAKFLRTTIT